MSKKPRKKKEQEKNLPQTDLDQICELRVSRFDRDNPGQSSNVFPLPPQTTAHQSVSLSVPLKPILIVSDHFENRTSWMKAVGDELYQVQCCTSESFIILAQAKQTEFSLIILDTDHISELLYQLGGFLRSAFEFTPLIIIGSGHVSRMKRDEYHEYLVGILKEFDPVFLLPLVSSGLKYYRTIQERNELNISMGFPVCKVNINFSGIPGASQRLDDDIRFAASQDGPVFIDAWPGANTDIVAANIHAGSSRSREPFDVFIFGNVLMNFRGPALFGLEKGTNALFPNGWVGKLELFNHGTVLIDEIANLRIPTQERLLSCLKTKSLYRINASRPIPNNTRILAAGSLSELKKWIDVGAFSKELFETLSQVTVRVPELKEYSDSLPPWIAVLSEWLCESIDRTPPRFTESAIDKMVNHSWPGNTRELHHLLRYLIFSNTSGIIDADDIDFRFMESPSLKPSLSPFMGLSYDEVERQFILETLAWQRGNRSATAKILGISEKTLYNKMKEYEKQGLMFAENVE